MCWFPMGAVTNNHKLGDLKQQKCNPLDMLKSEVGNWFHCAEIKMSEGSPSLQRLLRRIHCFPFPDAGG